MLFTLWGCFSFGCMRRSWNIFSWSCDSGNHQWTSTDWNDNIVGDNFQFFEKKLKATTWAEVWSRLEWKKSASPGWSSTNKCSKRSRAWALFPCFGHFVVVLHVCEIDKKSGILNDQFDPLQVCAPLSHSSAWSRDLIKVRDCLFGTSDDLLDDWVITYELSIYSSHLMTPS